MRLADGKEARKRVITLAATSDEGAAHKTAHNAAQQAYVLTSNKPQTANARA